jgi:predicted unusual protein kinase regulating ubiquinone biosynthesis (AarF/ABC1/UbiB family)
VGLVQLAHKYGISINIEVLRLLRATLLVESIAVRLDRKINFVKEYRRYSRYKAEQARRRVTDSILDQLEGKSNEQFIIRMDRIFQTLEGLYFRTIHSFSLPSINFTMMISKWSFTAYTIVRFFAQAFVMTAAAVGLVFISSALSVGFPVDLHGAVDKVLTNPFYQAVLLLLIFVNARAILFRLDDKEV